MKTYHSEYEMRTEQQVFTMRHPPAVLHQKAADSMELRNAAADDGEKINWAGSIHNLPEVWRNTMGKGAKVAVLDTGVDTDHPDLADAIEEARDFTGSGSVEDAQGHGTHCAGIIGARRNNAGFVGVAPECRLYIGKVLGDNGQGNYKWISDGIDWAVEKGAHIISMSLGGPVSQNSLYKAVHRALEKGVCIIAAAGNEGAVFKNSIGFPGRYGGVITVAAHDPNGNPAGFSSRGGEVDLMAPGTEIWSTYKDGGFASLSGTSMATPFVAGVSALIISKHLQQGGGTPVENNYDLFEHLVWLAAHPGYHDNAAGYGPLQPLSSVGFTGDLIAPAFD